MTGLFNSALYGISGNYALFLLVTLLYRGTTNRIDSRPTAGNSYYPNTRPFHSFKKAIKSNPDMSDAVELISFHSASKGVIGEVK